RPSPAIRLSSDLAGVAGLEPATPGFGDRGSNHCATLLRKADAADRRGPPRRCHALYTARLQGRRCRFLRVSDRPSFSTALRPHPSHQPPAARFESIEVGAGERNRTVVISLEGCCSTI